MDREWSSGSLGPDQAGWDWLALQLDDGREVMLYRLRRKDGGADPRAPARSSPPPARPGRSRPARCGSPPSTTGRARGAGARTRAAGDSRCRGLGSSWRYPALADQELIVGTRYWEGAVGVEGTATGDRPGSGYVELVGYGE